MRRRAAINLTYDPKHYDRIVVQI